MDKNLEQSLDQLDLRGTLLLMNLLAERALQLKLIEESNKKEPLISQGEILKPNNNLTLAKTDVSSLMPSKMVI